MYTQLVLSLLTLALSLPLSSSPSLALAHPLSFSSFSLVPLAQSRRPRAKDIPRTSHHLLTIIREGFFFSFFFSLVLTIAYLMTLPTDDEEHTGSRKGRQDRLTDMSSPLNTTSTPVGKQTTRKNPNDVSIYTGEIKE